jgi:phospholipase A-2-activating protein
VSQIANSYIASADKYIRVFDISGKLIKRFQASEDVVRALVRLPANHPSGAQFASAGNDNRIRLWTLEGVFMGELFGHENFIYSLGVLSSGEIVSSSEDRTVRIWSGTQCVQTITHPAISVWSVAVCKETGDIVTGSSDKIVRVFSRSVDRQADAEQLRAFEESVQASSIPQQSLGEINKTDLPGPDFLQNKSGTKEGQVQLIKETNGNVTAYQWTTQGNTWVSVGTVVDAAGSTTKITYNGQDYDYVFDVDIEDGKPALKLPYNVSQSPFEVARKFIETNKLPMTYVDSVVDFIHKNTKGAALGPQSGDAGGAPTGSDPWGTESRYRPDTGPQQPSQSAAVPKILPQKTYLAISTGSHKMILKKIQEFNDGFVDEGRKDLALQPADIAVLSDAISKLEPVAGKQEASISIPTGATNACVRAITEWPVDKRLPWLDMLRLLVAASPDAITQISSLEPSQSLVQHLASAGAFDRSISPDNNVMLAVRTLANLFCSKPGRTLADTGFDDILTLVEPFSSSPNKFLCIALTTLYINFAVLLTGGPASTKDEDAKTDGRDGNGDADRALTLLAALTQILNGTSDPEALYRALVAAGTVLCLGHDFAEVAREGLDIEAAVQRAEQLAGKEDRVAKLLKEVRALLAA